MELGSSCSWQVSFYSFGAVANTLKGRAIHRGFGLLGLLSIIDLIALVCFPDKHKAA